VHESGLGNVLGANNQPSRAADFVNLQPRIKVKPSPPVRCSTVPHIHLADLPAFHYLQVSSQDDSSSQRQGELQVRCSLLLCAACLYAARLPSSHAPDTPTHRQALLPLLGLLLLAWILELVGLIFVHRCARRPLTRVSICCA